MLFRLMYRLILDFLIIANYEIDSKYCETLVNKVRVVIVL